MQKYPCDLKCSSITADGQDYIYMKMSANTEQSVAVKKCGQVNPNLGSLIVFCPRAHNHNFKQA